MICRKDFDMAFGILIFDPKWRFWWCVGGKVKNENLQSNNSKLIDLLTEQSDSHFSENRESNVFQEY